MIIYVEAFLVPSEEFLFLSFCLVMASNIICVKLTLFFTVQWAIIYQ
jgi:hypothetical protein